MAQTHYFAYELFRTGYPSVPVLCGTNTGKYLCLIGWSWSYDLNTCFLLVDTQVITSSWTSVPGTVLSSRSTPTLAVTLRIGLKHILTIQKLNAKKKNETFNSRDWRIRVTQLVCDPNMSGCFQYLTGRAGKEWGLRQFITDSTL